MARNLIHELDHCMPAASHAQLGTTFQAVITNFNKVLTKLDAAGAATVTTTLAAALGTNNVASLTVTDLITLGNSEN
jgi:hypothetical protein